ncbi:MAG: PEP/pyruvate-binding domain-containing protein [Thermoplasmatota archaeon]
MTNSDGPAPVLKDHEELKKKEMELKERHKELNCLYEVSEIVENMRLSPVEGLQKIITVTPAAFQYPEITECRIVIGDEEYKTQGFRETPWSLVRDLIVHESKEGFIQMVYLEERPKEYEGPFLKDEIKLMKMLSELVGKFITLYRADQEVRFYKDRLKELITADSEKTPSASDEWKVILDILMKTDPPTLFRITRKMLYFLIHYKNQSFEDLMSVLVCPVEPKESEWCGVNIPNPRSDLQGLKRVQEGVFEIASEKLSSQEIMDLLTKWLKQNKALPLLFASDKPTITRGEITDQLKKYLDIPEAERDLSWEDDIIIRTNLIRRFFTGRLEYMNIAKDFIGIPDFAKLVDRIIGPSQSIGTLGGKVSGLFLAEKIIKKEMAKNENLHGVSFARSWYLSTDTMRDFVKYNALDEVAHIKYLNPAEIRQEQPFLEQVFKNGAFPSEIISGLREILRDLGSVPIIVRSSSHLEDSFGAAFSGKYKSLFLPNQGNEDQNLADLMDAIAEVWASTFNPNAIEYRRERGLLDMLESMGVLIQEVVGVKIGDFYLPTFAGVALSNNEFRWSPRIRREDGIARLVVGLGTRAVDRISDDYPVLISPRRPNLKVNTMVDELIQYSQKHMDVINLKEGRMESVDIKDFLRKNGVSFPLVSKMFSIYSNGDLIEPRGLIMDMENTDLIVTFNGFVERTKFLVQIRDIMDLLKEKMGTPVDVEFASNGKELFVLQCRPQTQAVGAQRVSIPSNVPNPMRVFSAKRYITTGYLKSIEYIVFVDPSAYEELTEREKMIEVAKVISELNLALPRRKFILMGPGRWGSRGDIKLGVPVQYRDINNTCLLIEVAVRKGGYLPELSFGTHFFQDLVEASIHYLPLYPDEGDSYLNENLISSSENHLLEKVDWAGDFVNVVKVVKVREIAQGGTMSVVMDGEANEALAFLVPPDHSEWRLSKVREMLSTLDPVLFGIKDIFLLGSTKEYTAGPASDIDLIVHYDGRSDNREDLLAWFEEWSVNIDRENCDRTGIKTGGLLDVHLVTDGDIQNRTSWAMHIIPPYGMARKMELTNKR